VNRRFNIDQKHKRAEPDQITKSNKVTKSDSVTRGMITVVVWMFYKFFFKKIK
jgi:hypothetical protein